LNIVPPSIGRYGHSARKRCFDFFMLEIQIKMCKRCTDFSVCTECVGEMDPWTTRYHSNVNMMNL
jgi:hypothetical protein